MNFLFWFLPAVEEEMAYESCWWRWWRRRWLVFTRVRSSSTFHNNVTQALFIDVGWRCSRTCHNSQNDHISSTTTATIALFSLLSTFCLLSGNMELYFTRTLTTSSDILCLYKIYADFAIKKAKNNNITESIEREWKETKQYEKNKWSSIFPWLWWWW